ncbi:MAG: hypothetical protein JXA92_10800 [candidate division Zixibacteria bacterium]|nr:hypothetical protein [candidate division Zixibacteria bacterium]
MVNISRLKLIIATLSLAVVIGLSCGDDDERVNNPDNNPPVIDSITAEPDTFVAGSSTIVMVTAHDPDDDALSYSWILREIWMEVLGGSGSIRQIRNCCSGSGLSTGYVVIDVSDNQGGSVRDSIRIWVQY